MSPYYLHTWERKPDYLHYWGFLPPPPPPYCTWEISWHRQTVCRRVDKRIPSLCFGHSTWIVKANARDITAHCMAELGSFKVIIISWLNIHHLYLNNLFGKLKHLHNYRDLITEECAVFGRYVDFSVHFYFSLCKTKIKKDSLIYVNSEVFLFNYNSSNNSHGVIEYFCTPTCLNTAGF